MSACTSFRASRGSMQGLSLVELMVALTIGLILTLGLVEVFAASKSAYRTAEGIARVQENARFALDYLQRDIRMIGHFGCVNDQSHKLQAGAFGMHTGAAAGGPLDFNLSVEGFEANSTQPGQTVNLAAAAAGWTPALPAHLSGLNPSPGSDIIMLRFLRGTGAPVANVAVSGANATVTLVPGTYPNLTDDGVATPDLFGIADCAFANIFTGPGNAGAGTVTANGVGGAIDRYTSSPTGHTALYRAEAVAYYVGVSNVSNQRSLMRARWNGAGVRTVEELVEGIESLQLLYGQDQSVDVTRPTGYVANQDTAATLSTATTPAGEQQWRRVGLVQIGLIAASTSPASVAQATQAPTALGVGFASGNDGRLRVAYESTVALRNRLYGN